MADKDTAVASVSPQRKKVTRACDTCKKRKVKCDGLEPCSRCCKSSNNVCSYAASYNRIRGRFAPYTRRQAQRSAPRSSAERGHVELGVRSSRSPQPENSHTTEADLASGASDIDGCESGDASVHAFLKRFSHHLAQVGQDMPRNLFKRQEEQGGFNKRDYVRTLLLPEKRVAVDYFDAYFEHGNATCRFLPPKKMYDLLNQLYSGDDSFAYDHASDAILLLIMGTGCVWTASWKNKPLSPWRAKALPFLYAAESRLEKVDRIFPPPLSVLQAYVLKCQCEVGLGRFNDAWMSLGWAIRLSQMINLQREQAPSCGVLEAHYRRSLFWAMFMMDRYLAVILGRPSAFHERDITISLPLDDNNMLSSKLEPRESKCLIGTVAHYRLVNIIGHAVCRLYSASKPISAPSDEIVTELEQELAQWLQQTPSFFHPKRRTDSTDSDELFYDVPWIVKRQQRTVQSAFLFANMLIYRGYLLREFVQRFHTTPNFGKSAERIRKCVDNAKAMLSLAAQFGVDECKYNGTFWFTSHFVFCAISILLVYLTICKDAEDRAAIEAVIEEGMRFHRKLDNNPNTTAQRLLDGSQSQVAKSINTPSPSGLAQDPQRLLVRESGPTSRAPPTAVPDSQDSTAQHIARPQDSAVESIPGLFGDTDHLSFEALESVDGFDMIMDIGFDNSSFFEALEQGDSLSFGDFA